jgi:hypothetical protein
MVFLNLSVILNQTTMRFSPPPEEFYVRSRSVMTRRCRQEVANARIQDLTTLTVYNSPWMIDLCRQEVGFATESKKNPRVVIG